MTFVFWTGPSDAWRDVYGRDMANLEAKLKALINQPSVISTMTLRELGGQANKKQKVEVLLPQPGTLAWESPVWAHVASFSNQLLKADKGQRNGLQSLFGHLLPTAPTNTSFVFHHVHTRHTSLAPLTIAAVIKFQQGGGYGNDENVGKTITCGRVFLQQFPQTLLKMLLVGLTTLLSITLVFVRLDSNAQGAEHLSSEMSARLPDVKHPPPAA